MYTELEDSQLIKLICSANHDAFAELVSRHADKYFKLAYQSLQNRSDAEDVVQSAFIKFWQKPSAWDGKKSRFTTWFYRVVLNACNDIHRKNKHRAKPYQFDESMLAGEQVSIDGQSQFDGQIATSLSARTFSQSEEHLLNEKQQAAQQQQCLEFAISQLPDTQRDALNLVVYSELPQKQAAMVMGVSLKALESLLVRARKALVQTAQKHMQAMSSQHDTNANQIVWSNRQ